MLNIFNNMKHSITNFDDVKEFDFIDSRCNVTVVKFTDEFSYVLLDSKNDSVLLKMHIKDCRKLEEKINRKKATFNKTHEVYVRFRKLTQKICKINTRLKLLNDKLIKLKIFEFEEQTVNKVKQDILNLIEKKKDIQTSLLVYIDLLLEDDLL